MLQVERFLRQSRTLLRLCCLLLRLAVFGNKDERVFVSFRQNRPNQTCSIFGSKSNDRAISCCRSSGVDDLTESRRLCPCQPFSFTLLIYLACLGTLCKDWQWWVLFFVVCSIQATKIEVGFWITNSDLLHQWSIPSKAWTIRNPRSHPAWPDPPSFSTSFSNGSKNNCRKT